MKKLTVVIVMALMLVWAFGFDTNASAAGKGICEDGIKQCEGCDGDCTICDNEGCDKEGCEKKGDGTGSGRGKGKGKGKGHGRGNGGGCGRGDGSCGK